LPYLAKVVQASADTLQRLELQGNGWEIDTPMALHDWEEFLDSFKNCAKLRKVNFSDNRLGDKGIEAFVRTYMRGLQGSMVEHDANEDIANASLSQSISGLSLEFSDDEDDLSSTLGTSMEVEPCSPGVLAASLPITSSRRRIEDSKAVPTRGIPSVAYIALENAGLTDLSALHLTYLLPYHNLPHVLLSRLDAHIADTTIGREDELYDKDNFCRGILYYGGNINDFSPLAKKLLESVEKVRRAGGLIPEPRVDTSPFVEQFSSVPPSPNSFRSRRNSDSSRGYFPDTPSPLRKESISSIRSMSSVHFRSGSLFSMNQPSRNDGTVHWTDVVKTRPKLQGEILKSAKTLHVSQLWSASIKLLSLGRIFTLPQIEKIANRPTNISRVNKRNIIPRPILPPSPVSPGTPKSTEMKRSCGVGSLDSRTWLKILLPVADPEGVLSDVQAMNVISWASDRATLAREGEWAGKLMHVQMWKLLDVSSISILRLTKRLWSVLAMRCNR
jgi:hypothetical protein